VFLSLSTVYHASAAAENIAYAKYYFSPLPNNISNRTYQYRNLLRVPNGNLWVATNHGLHVFDGYRFDEVNSDIGIENAPKRDESIIRLSLNNKGDMWVGTYKGAFVYEPNIQKWNNYSATAKGPAVLDDSVFSLYQDDNGDMWLGTINSLVKFDDKNKKYEFFHPSNNSLDLNNKNNLLEIAISGISQQSENIFWLASYRYGLLRYDRANGTVDKLEELNLSQRHLGGINALIRLDASNLLIATGHGLYRFDTQSHNLHSFPMGKPVTDNIYSIVRDNNGDIWCGGKSLYQIIGEKHIIEYKHDKDFGITEKDISIGAITVDQENTIYVAFNGKGIYKASPYLSNVKWANDFQFIGHHGNKVLQSNDNRIWFGFKQGLVVSEKQMSGFSYNTLKKTNNEDFIDVFDIHEGVDDTIWVAERHAVTRILKNGKMKTFPFNQGLSYENHISSVVEDYSGNLWLTVTSKGIFKLNIETGEYIEAEALLEQNLYKWSNIWLSISYDRKRLLFVKSTNGYGIYDIASDKIDVVYKTTKLQFPYEKKHPLLDARTAFINFNDTDASVNISHGAGYFSRFDWMTDELNTINVDKSSIVLGVIKDRFVNDVYWLTTIDNTIFKWSTKSGILDTISLPQYSGSVALHPGAMLSDGTLIWPTENGIAYYEPAHRTQNKTVPIPIVSQIKVNNHLLPTQTYNSWNLSQDNDVEIELDYTQNFLEFQFKSSSFTQVEKNQFKYRLVGAHNNWLLNTGNDRKALFADLPSGSYTFELLVSNNDGVWSEEPERINIYIARPWWFSYPAFALYLLIVLGLFIRRESKKRQQAFQLEQKIIQRTLQLRKSKEDVERLMEEKNKLTENIYHQTRTPLQLMLGHLGAFQAKDITEEELLTKQKNEIYKISHLTDQVLDVLKVSELSKKTQEVSSVFKQLALCFEDAAKAKRIDFQWYVEPNIFLNCSLICIEKAVDNLLSNSVKYTQRGHVRFTVKIELEQLSIVCEDTGIGIPQSELATVFKRYQRGSNSASQDGSGIGLAIVSDVITAHDGKVDIESKVGQGTKVTITLPTAEPVQQQEALINSLPDTPVEVIDEAMTDDMSRPFSILIVEDNLELACYLQKLLQIKYAVRVALNGESAFFYANKEVPDIIISDIMMTELDGYHLTEKLKLNEITSHIPVILLTAKGDHDSREKGFAVGANDFITKPFNEDELFYRIRNQLKQVDSIKKRVLVPKQKAPDEDKLIARFISLVSESYKDIDLQVNDICQNLHVSSRQLERKLKHYFDVTPKKYLNDYRLQRAKELLEAGHPSGEVFNECGFASHAYFSKCFRDKYGLTPSKVAANASASQ